jgi:NADPH:quinone reductase-like Zn-dependent oxidoreductase
MTGEVPKPRLVESRDVLVKVTGSSICGSDLHLLHGSIVELQKGDILGHEFCGIIEALGTSVTGLKVGDRVVASFQIACGDVRCQVFSQIQVTRLIELVLLLPQGFVLSVRKDKLRCTCIRYLRRKDSRDLWLQPFHRRICWRPSGVC